MMSIEQVRAESNKRARIARRLGLESWAPIDADEVLCWGRCPIPFLGSYVPEGWELIDDFFVDSSGLGSDDEPALTYSRFKKLAAKRVTDQPGVGFAITEAGECQVYVGVYQRR